MTADDLDRMSREELDAEFTRQLDERVLAEYRARFGEPLPSGSGWPPGVLVEHARMDLLERLGLEDIRWLVP